TVATTNADGPGKLDVPLGQRVAHAGAEYRYFDRTLPGEWKYSRPLGAWLGAHVGEFDVVHVHALFTYPNLAGCRAARRAGVPYVIRPLGTLGAWSLGRRGWKKRPYLALVERRYLRDAAAIHVTSASEGEAVSALGYGALVREIPMGIELPSVAEPGHAVVDGPLRLLFLSRIHPGKGLPLVFDALRRLADDGVRFELAVVGDGDAAYVAEMKAMAQRLGVADRVVFLGRLEGDAKLRRLHHADVFVLPSSHENFGLAVGEALGAGLPVVISDQVGIAGDVLDAGAGLVTRLDAGDIANAIRELAGDPARRASMGRAGRRLAEGRYSWAEAAHGLRTLYEDIAASRARRRAAGIAPLARPTVAR
ncbi:MAG TPA: glycosyltransferase, partial [Gaiellaceae bacterium]|nr:glycosyltransferase [Gaiellaceae bacterium]